MKQYFIAFCLGIICFGIVLEFRDRLRTKPDKHCVISYQWQQENPRLYGTGQFEWRYQKMSSQFITDVAEYCQTNMGYDHVIIMNVLPLEEP